MIMQADTPRSLSAAGWLLLGLAAFALPVAARAQAPAQATAKEQEIKALKARLRALEDAGKARQGVLEVVLDAVQDQDAEAAKKMKATADLKAQIAKKRAELQDLEAKLKAVLAAVDPKQAGKIKIDQAKGDKAVIEAILVDGQVKAKLVDKAKKQLMEIDINVDDLIKQGVLPIDKIKDKIKIKALEGKPIEVILDQLKVEPGNQEIIIKMLDGKTPEGVKVGDVIKKLDDKRLEGELKGKILLAPQKAGGDVKVIIDGTPGKGDDIEARLERLMKELQQLQREVKASKKPQVK